MSEPLYSATELAGMTEKARKLVEALEGAETCHGDDPCVEVFLDAAHSAASGLADVLSNCLCVLCPACHPDGEYNRDGEGCEQCSGSQFVTRVEAAQIRAAAKD